jgi:hypothetical protein
MADAKTALKCAYTTSKLIDLLHYPPVDSAINWVDSYLGSKYVRVWTDAFLAESWSPTANLVVQPVIYTKMMRFTSTFFLSYSHSRVKTSVTT